jgi:hypothetical protein
MSTIFPGSDRFSNDPASKITAVKAAQKFFSEDKDRDLEAKVAPLAGLPFLRCIEFFDRWWMRVFGYLHFSNRLRRKQMREYHFSD